MQRHLLLALMACMASACTPKGEGLKVHGVAQEVALKDTPVSIPQKLPPGLHTLKVPQQGGSSFVLVDVRIPTASPNGTVLVLPGWNFPRTDWCVKTNLALLADSIGLILIMPEMGKSIYASHYYPETRVDYRLLLTRPWLTDTLIHFMQDSLGILVQGQPNYLLGLSTGARGVALTVLATDTLFKAGIALSGDYDQREMPADNLIRNTYGPITTFPERWAGADNPASRSNNLHVPLYLAHGQLDKVVPWQQTQLFADSLKANNPKLPIQLVLAPKAQHDYAFWGSQLADAFNWALQQD